MKPLTNDEVIAMPENAPLSSNQHELIRIAFERKEFDKILRQCPEYCYKSRFSLSPDKTDIGEMLNAMYYDMQIYTREALCEQLSEAIYKSMDCYEAIGSIATCILYETLSIEDKTPIFGLPLREITLLFRKAIKRFQDRLKSDKSGRGARYEDGMYESLSNRSRTVVQHGGMPFCEGT